MPARPLRPIALVLVVLVVLLALVVVRRLARSPDVAHAPEATAEGGGGSSARPDPGPVDATSAEPATLDASSLGGEQLLDRALEQVREWTIPLDGRLDVSVLDLSTKAPIPGAVATARLELRWSPARSTHVAFERTATADALGAARFDAFPRGHDIEVVVSAEGHRPRTERVRIERTEAERSIVVELRPALSAVDAGVRVDLLGDGPLEGASVLVRDATAKVAHDATIGGIVPLDDDPSAPDAHELDVQLLLPGYAGPPIHGVFRRGTTTAIPRPTSRPIAQEIAVLDERGAGVPDLEVSVFPASPLTTRHPATRASARTDARGVARIPGYAATTWEVVPDEAEVHVPDAIDAATLVVGSGLRTIRVLRKASFRFLVDVPPPEPTPVRLALEWRSYRPPPGSDVERALGAAAEGEAAAHDEYLRTLPLRVSASRSAPGSVAIPVRLLPGAYLVRPSVVGAISPEITLEVLASGGEVRIAFARLGVVRLELSGSAERSDVPLPHGVIIVPRAVGWDERLALVTGLGALSASRTRKPAPPPGEETLDAVHERTQALRLARLRYPWVGADATLSGANGATRAEAIDEPTHVTVLYPDHRAAIVRLEGGGGTYRGRVEPASFRSLEIRVETASGAAVPDAVVPLTTVAALRAGETPRLSGPRTDASGRVRVGIPDEGPVAVRAIRHASGPTPSDATVETVRDAAGVGYLVTPSRTGTPSVTFVVGSDVVDPSPDDAGAGEPRTGGR